MMLQTINLSDNLVSLISCSCNWNSWQWTLKFGNKMISWWFEFLIGFIYHFLIFLNICYFLCLIFLYISRYTIAFIVTEEFQDDHTAIALHIALTRRHQLSLTGRACVRHFRLISAWDRHEDSQQTWQRLGQEKEVETAELDQTDTNKTKMRKTADTTASRITSHNYSY